MQVRYVVLFPEINYANLVAKCGARFVSLSALGRGQYALVADGSPKAINVLSANLGYGPDQMVAA